MVHRLTVSVATGYIGKPGKGPRARDIPVMVVNPSCEQLLLERDDTGGWRNATLDEFAALGLAPATETSRRTSRRCRPNCAANS